MLGSRSWLLASTTDGDLVIARANPQKYEEVRRTHGDLMAVGKIIGATLDFRRVPDTPETHNDNTNLKNG